MKHRTLRNEVGLRGFRVSFGLGPIKPVSRLCNEPISLPRNCLNEAWPFRIVAQRQSDLADGSIDAVLGINENVLAPELFDDFLPGDETPIFAHQENE